MKLNINYMVDEQITNECLNINQKINQLAQGDINFSDGTCRPHITLLMGDVDEENLPEIEKRMKGLNFTSLYENIKFKKPYISGKYIVIDVEDDTKFKQDCQMLLDTFSDILTPGHFNIAKGTATPHITLGFAKKNPELEAYIESLEPLPDTMVDTISVAEAGAHGTVLVKPQKQEEKQA